VLTVRRPSACSMSPSGSAVATPSPDRSPSPCSAGTRSTCTTARPTGTARRCCCRCSTRRPPARSPRSPTGCGGSPWTAGATAGGRLRRGRAGLGGAICGWAGLPITPQNARRRSGTWPDRRRLRRHRPAACDGSAGPQALRALGGPSWSGTYGPPATSRPPARPWRRWPGTGTWTASSWTSTRRPWSCSTSVRPTVAVAWFMAFAALALHQHPNWTERLATGGGQTSDGDLEAFAHEVAACTPLPPAGRPGRPLLHLAGPPVPGGAAGPAGRVRHQP
jgi:hypothetical protein